MNITLLCSDNHHPVVPYLKDWMTDNSQQHNIQLLHKKKYLVGGQILFLISCDEIITSDDRSKYEATLVLHASDLPKGRGWSPHIWQLLSGSDTIVLSMLEAEDKVDSGRIWKKTEIPVPNHLLWDEINHLLFDAEVRMLNFAVQNFKTVEPKLQSELEPTYFPKRKPEDNRLEPEKSISEQFDLIRISDPVRYPAYIDYRGHRYLIKLEKADV